MAARNFVPVHRVDGPHDQWLELCFNSSYPFDRAWSVYYCIWDGGFGAWDTGGGRFATYEDALTDMEAVAEGTGICVSNA